MKKKLCLFLILFFSTFAYSKEVSKITRTDLLNTEKALITIYQNSVHSVVNVSNVRTMRDFFNTREEEVTRGTGSGFVWDDSGHIITNAHVVMGGDKFIVSFKDDKKQYQAKLVGVAKHRDIAVLKLIEKKKPLVPLNRGTSNNLLVGQMAIAIGSPFNLDHTMTRGIISATKRDMQGFGGLTITGMIQTDAAINPGNSGGPLLDSLGRLIGMNTQIISSSRSSAGLGFAVPVDMIKRVVPQLIEHGAEIKPILGISAAQSITQARLGINEGILVMEASSKEAKKAGLKGTYFKNNRVIIGDIIIAVDGKKTNSIDSLWQILDKKSIGDVVEVKYIRDGKEKTTKIKLSAYRVDL